MFTTTIYAQVDKSSADYTKGIHILEQTNQRINSRNGEIGSIDYWNLAVGTAFSEQDKVKTYEYLLKSQQLDNAGFYENMEYLISFSNKDIRTTYFYKLLGQKFLNLFETSKNGLKSSESSGELEVENIKNQEVVNILIEMMDRDTKYRTDKNFLFEENLQKKQYELDAVNRAELIKLFDKYGYVGKSITGDNLYKNYICLLVEHGQNLTDQKKWLPIIAEAYNKGEMTANPLKMLLDRIGWKENNKQYFGSHIGVPFASKEDINAIKLKYGIE